MALTFAPAPVFEPLDSFAQQQWMMSLSQVLSSSTFDEAVQDTVGGILVDTATIDFTYTDATPSITASVKTDSINDTHIDWGSGANQVDTTDVPEGTNLYYTDERAQDAVGSMVLDTITIDLVYTDLTPSLSADVRTNSISNTLLSDMADTTIKGRAVGAGTGDPTDLTAAQLVTIINTADGSGSLLDSDFLDGQSGAYYLDSANFTGTSWTDLTDAGATTLHKHDHGNMDGLTDDDHGHYWNYARGAARMSLRV